MIDELLRLLRQIDAEDMDVEIDSRIRSVRPDTDKEGPEKFAARRRIKRLNRLLNQNDYSVATDDESSDEPSVSIFNPEDTDAVTVTVDGEANCRIEAGQLRLWVPDTDYTDLKVIDVESPQITDRTVNNGITTIEISPA